MSVHGQGDPTSRLYKQHHIDKARNALSHAKALTYDYDATMEDLRSPIGLDLLDAMEHIALAYGVYISGIGMECRPDMAEGFEAKA